MVLNSKHLPKFQKTNSLSFPAPPAPLQKKKEESNLKQEFLWVILDRYIQNCFG